MADAEADTQRTLETFFVSLTACAFLSHDEPFEETQRRTWVVAGPRIPSSLTEPLEKASELTVSGLDIALLFDKYLFFTASCKSGRYVRRTRSVCHVLVFVAQLRRLEILVNNVPGTSGSLHTVGVKKRPHDWLQPLLLRLIREATQRKSIPGSGEETSAN